MARRPNQVSMPNPEFGVDFDASARAMHQSASKGSLMVHEKAFSMPAVARKSLVATMFERNTMLKTLKRKIALVAVSVLGASGLAVVAAPAANAVVATVTGTVTPIRVTYSGTNTTADAVPAAELKITTTAVLTDANTRGTLTILSAPKSGAELVIGSDATLANNAIASLESTAAGTTDDAAAGTLLGADTTASTQFSIPIYFRNSTATNAPVAGTYTFRLQITDTTGGNTDEITVNGSFTTTGAPTSLTVTPTSTSLLISGVDTSTATLKDANGKVTQPLTVDGLTLTTTAGTFTDGTNSAVTATELNEGEIELTYTAANAAGSATATVTPTGTLPFFGSTAQTITYNYSGSIDVVALTALSISAPVVPTTAITGTLAAGDRAAIVPQGTSAITISATGTASSKIRLRAVVSAGTVNGAAATGAAPQYFNVDTAATTGAATLALTLGGAALASTATLTITQVDVANAPVVAGGQVIDIVITQTDRTAAAGTVTASPKGSLVAKLGASTSVAVTAKDQFGTALGAGYTIRAYRTAAGVPANLLDAKVTDASGVATVTLTPATTTTVSGTVEAYVLTYTEPGRSVAQEVTMTDAASITYTTTGNATALQVVVNNAGAVTATLNAQTTAAPATTQAVLPSLVVPFDGTADDTAGTEIYTVSNATATTSSITDYATRVNSQEAIGVTATASPANSVTWTAVSDGAFVSTTAAAAKWDAGVKTATVANATEIFLYSTKTGIQKWTATSGGLTREFSAYVYTSQFAHYNISVDLPTMNLDGGDYKVVKVKVTDVFGNPVGTPANAVSIAATGATLLGGYASSATATTSATTGEASVTIIGNATGGTGTVTVTPASTMVGPWLTTGFTKPTNAPDPVKSATVTTTVKAAAAASSPAVDAVKADVKAVSDTVATLSKAVTTIQSSVTELTSSFATQIKSLTDAIAKISRAIAALSKKVSAKK